MFFNLSQTRLFDYLTIIIWPALLATLKMLVVSALLGFLFGGICAVILVVTRPRGLAPRRLVYKSINYCIDITRSFPALIMIVALAPFTKLLVQTSVGWLAASVTLSIITIPLVTRLVEASLLEVNPNTILAAKAFGATNWQILTRVMLVEAKPALVNNMTFILIQALANTTLAGAVGAGGLGAVALTFGYERFDDVVTYFVVFIIGIMVWTIQAMGQFIYNRLK